MLEEKSLVLHRMLLVLISRSSILRTLGTTSERTTEVNILCDISLIVKQRFKTNVTIISPARVEINEQESDLLTHKLRNGQIIIFQFKKPFSYPSNRNNNYKKFIIETEVLAVYVRDRGEGFDPTTLPNPLDPDNLLNPNGRGIFYMRTFMDEVEYSSHPEGGSIVRMTKYKRSSKEEN